MKARIAFCVLLLMVPLPAQGQIMPKPSMENPRIQTVRWVDGEEVVLTLLPKTGMTVMLEPGERITRITTDNSQKFDLRVSADQDSFLILPQVENAAGVLSVDTDRRNYRMRLRSSSELMAAYLVRFDYALPELKPIAESVEDKGPFWFYRLRGDRSVRPKRILDNGNQTKIIFSPEQDLPAVFAIGPTGKEQVVNGYMRDDVFVIDRVWNELVFRIDRDKATARRNSKPGVGDG